MTVSGKGQNCAEEQCGCPSNTKNYFKSFLEDFPYCLNITTLFALISIMFIMFTFGVTFLYFAFKRATREDDLKKAISQAESEYLYVSAERDIYRKQYEEDQAKVSALQDKLQNAEMAKSSMSKQFQRLHSQKSEMENKVNSIRRDGKMKRSTLKELQYQVRETNDRNKSLLSNVETLIALTTEAVNSGGESYEV